MKQDQKAQADFHVHTSFSGGTLTPSQVVIHATENNLTRIAITDTFSVGGVDEAFRTACDCSINIIPGLELKAQENGHTVSIVGLFIDPDHPTFHIELPYYQRGHRTLTIVEAIELVRNCKGLPILANPFVSLNGSCTNKQMLNNTLYAYKNWGVMGVEVYRPEHDAETTALLETVTLALDLVCSGGSDFHTPDDKYHQLGKVNMPLDTWDKLRTAAITLDI